MANLRSRWTASAVALTALTLASPALVPALVPAGLAATAATAGSAPTATAPAARLAALTQARQARLRWGGPLEFGVYPGGGAGAVNGRGAPRPEDPQRREQALQALRPAGKPFVVHLYDAYTGAADVAATPAWLRGQLDGYTAAGLRVELVLRYRPAQAGGDPAGFAAFVRSRVRELGPNPAVTSLQITNEANVRGAPDAADGAYRGATRALVAGVIAAKREATRRGHNQLAVGFNWANASGPAEDRFFTALARLGGRPFAASVDWVGVDAYPGTWGPALPAGGLARGVRTATRTTLARLRGRLLPRAGLARTPIVFAESGYPTDFAARTESRQAAVMQAAVETVVALRRRYGVVGYRWFDLRDADSAATSFESQYGLLRDDYSPKAGFQAYRRLIALHS